MSLLAFTSINGTAERTPERSTEISLRWMQYVDGSRLARAGSAANTD